MCDKLFTKVWSTRCISYENGNYAEDKSSSCSVTVEEHTSGLCEKLWNTSVVPKRCPNRRKSIIWLSITVPLNKIPLPLLKPCCL